MAYAINGRGNQRTGRGQWLLERTEMRRDGRNDTCPEETPALSRAGKIGSHESAAKMDFREMDPAATVYIADSETDSVNRCLLWRLITVAVAENVVN